MSGSGTAVKACWSARTWSAPARVRLFKSGSASSLGVAKLKAEVRSPSTARRHGLMLSSGTPKRASRKRSTEVWSKAWELTQPPRLHGDTTYIGTRGPGP
ncbi:hypothetical protein D3C71_1410880 [compost metagenome]